MKQQLTVAEADLDRHEKDFSGVGKPRRRILLGLLILSICMFGPGLILYDIAKEFVHHLAQSQQLQTRTMFAIDILIAVFGMTCVIGR